jgi:lysosomal acid lipase/cholesteryl ester hydrolase
MAQHDIPAVIEFILEKTGVEKLSFIGHGSGTTQMFAALCERPDFLRGPDFFRDRVNIFCMMGPVVFLNNCQATGIHKVKKSNALLFGAEWFGPELLPKP